MRPESKVSIGIACAALLSGAFLLGRHEETARLAERNAQSSVSASETQIVPETQEAADYRRLPIDRILALPFTQFYEALRSAPRAAREQWATELEKMPPGPRQTAALLAFYKLLVQFDPEQAIRALMSYKGESRKGMALDAVVSAAPSSALPRVAELLVSVDDPRLHGSGLSDLLYEWSLTDPAAAVKFREAHSGKNDSIISSDLISNWAALDPAAAREWLDSHPSEPDPINPDPFILGWYESDRPAAVKYVLEHAAELASKRTLATIFSALYFDKDDAARKFFEALPSDDLRHKVLKGMADLAGIRPAEETGDFKQAPRALVEWITQFSPEYWKGDLSDVLKSWSSNQISLVTDVALRDRLLQAMFQHTYLPEDALAREINAMSLSPDEGKRALELAHQAAAASEAERLE